MNVILYNSNNHKTINGTLFYCFEYFLYIKQYQPDIKYFILNADLDNFEMFKSVFKEKYTFDHKFLEDFVLIPKLTDIARSDIKNLLILDINTYTKVRYFLSKVDNVRIYSNDTHKFINTKPNHTFYGWYPYQIFNIKERLKLYKEVHITYNTKGDSIFLSSPQKDNDSIVLKLGLDENKVYTKKYLQHNEKLFENINEIIYWHTGQLDKNNRIVAESYLHDIPIKVYLNGNENDSIKERHDIICNGDPDVLFLSDDDKLIRDFLNDCNS